MEGFPLAHLVVLVLILVLLKLPPRGSRTTAGPVPADIMKPYEPPAQGSLLHVRAILDPNENSFFFRLFHSFKGMLVEGLWSFSWG